MMAANHVVGTGSISVLCGFNSFPAKDFSGLDNSSKQTKNASFGFPSVWLSNVRLAVIVESILHQ